MEWKDFLYDTSANRLHWSFFFVVVAVEPDEDEGEKTRKAIVAKYDRVSILLMYSTMIE